MPVSGNFLILTFNDHNISKYEPGFVYSYRLFMRKPNNENFFKISKILIAKTLFKISQFKKIIVGAQPMRVGAF